MSNVKYEFVSKSEYAPIKDEFYRILQRANSYIQNDHPELKFRIQLVGSGDRHLVTRIINGNKGFDFDFNLVLDYPGDGQKYFGKVVNDIFMNCLNKAIEGTGFSAVNDSTSVLTIKLKDRKNSKILYSCDLAIVYYDPDGVMHYRLHNKTNGGYGFQTRFPGINVDERVDYIRQYENGWNCIREEYLTVKNANNDPDKRSFILFVEAVNNVYNRFLEEDGEEEEDDYYDDDDDY